MESLSAFLERLQSGTEDALQAIQEHPLLTVYVTQKRTPELVAIAALLADATAVEQVLRQGVSALPLPVLAPQEEEDPEDQAFLHHLASRPVTVVPQKQYKTMPTVDPVTGTLVYKRGRPPKGHGKKEKRATVCEQESLPSVSPSLLATLARAQEKAAAMSPEGWTQHTWTEDDLVAPEPREEENEIEPEEIIATEEGEEEELDPALLSVFLHRS